MVLFPDFMKICNKLRTVSEFAKIMFLSTLKKIVFKQFKEFSQKNLLKKTVIYSFKIL